MTDPVHHDTDASNATFTRLVQAHHAAVYRSAYRIVRHAADAEDVVQQVYLRVCEHPQKFATAANPERVLCWLAIRLGLVAQRGTRRRTTQQQEPTMADYETTDPTTFPVEQAAHGEQRRMIEAQLEALPDELRLPLVLRFQEGMTLAAVATALACAESTAHQRVQRGLDKLRRALARAGLGCSVALVTGTLGASGAPPAVAGLAAKLLDLPGKTLRAAPAPASATTSAAGAGSLLVGIGVVLVIVAFIALRPASIEPENPAVGIVTPATTASAAPSLSPRTAVASPTMAPPHQDPQPQRACRVIGSVQDERGAPVAAAQVRAWSDERQPGLKRARFERATRTAWDGSFLLELPVANAGGQPYSFVVLAAEREQHHATLVAQANAELRLDAIRLAPPGHAGEGGPCSIEMTVVGVSDQPLAGVKVALFALADPLDTFPSAPSGPHGTTDATGHLTLACTGRAPRKLLVDGRAAGARAELVPVEFDPRGRATVQVRLLPGLTVHGVVRSVEGTPLPSTSLRVHDLHLDLTSWHHSGADGGFAITGLGEGPYAIYASIHRYSPAMLRVAGGAADVTFALKRSDDLRDHGTHLAEIHGTVRDAATGAGVDVSVFAVSPVRVEPLEQIDAHVVDRIDPRPVQVMASDPPAPSPEFHLDGLTPGRWWVVVRQRGYALAWSGPYDLDTHTVATGIVVDLHQGATARATVTDPDGAPVAGASLLVIGGDAASAAKLRDQDTTVQRTEGRNRLIAGALSKHDGRFTRTHLPAGLPLRIAVVHPNFEPYESELLVLREGEQRLIEAKLLVRR